MKKLISTKIIAIVGPTASGKSALAVQLAKRFKGEIVSADSRQVYKGMDIGTAKVTKKQMAGIPHHLLSVANPKGVGLNVNKFKKLADRKIAEIVRRGHLPILAGGTGFWIDAVAFGKEFPDAPADPKLRKKLYIQSAAELFSMLKRLNISKAKTIDSHNKVRLVRAIEIALYNKKRKTKEKPVTKEVGYETLFLGLDMPTQKLYERIQKKLNERMKQGLVDEVRRLHRNGVSWKKLEAFGLEYRFVSRFIQGKIQNSKGKPDKEKMLELLLYAIKHYAKRQRTWFKRNNKIIWLDPNAKNYNTRAVLTVQRWLNS